MLVNSLPFSNIRSANSFFGWPFSTSKARRCFASDGPILGTCFAKPCQEMRDADIHRLSSRQLPVP